MGQYRKKPVIIEAVQLRWDNWSEMCDFIGKENFSRYRDWETPKDI